jgi:DNA-binding beta-propeller fold protein YncE
MRFPRIPRIAAVVAAISAGFLPLFAQQVYVANSSNGRISVFDAATGSSVPFAGNTSMLVTPLGIALDGTGRLIVCDNQRGRVLRYGLHGEGPTILASEITRPDGPSVATDGSIFVVTSPDGAKSSRTNDLFVIPGGAGPAVKVVTIGDSTQLRDTAVSPLAPFAGQLMVLSSKPGFVARFEKVGASWIRRSDFISSFPFQPSGMAFTSTGDLLVSTFDGVILRYDASGNRLADFAVNLGRGQTRIAVATSGIVYVTNKNGPALFRFDPSGNPLPAFFGDLQSPAGVATQDLSATPVGTNVTVTPLPGVDVTFDVVNQSGFTTGQQTELAPGVFVTPCGNLLPGFTTPPVGADHFTIIRLDTTAGFTDSIEVAVTHPDGTSRLFHAPCAPSVGDAFEDVTTLAIPGDPRGRIPQFSEFVVVTDTRALGVVIQVKSDALNALVAPGSPAETFINFELLTEIRTLIATANFMIGEGSFSGAIDQLQALKTLVRQNSGTAIPNSASSPGGNIAGQLESKAATLIFSLSLSL